MRRIREQNRTASSKNRAPSFCLQCKHLAEIPMRPHSIYACIREKNALPLKIDLRSCCPKFAQSPETRRRKRNKKLPRRIPLTNGRYALVSHEDYERIAQYKWYAENNVNTFYARSTTKKTENMHRMIMNPPDDMVIDHIDGNGLNNTRENLRIATTAQNNYNVGPKRNSLSKYKGVRFCKKRKMWRVDVQCKNKIIRKGYFKEEIAAARAYDDAAKKLFGEFAWLNFPDE